MLSSTRKQFYFSPSVFKSYIASIIMLLMVGYLYCAYQLLWANQGTNWLFLLMMIQVTPFLFCFGRQNYNFLSFVLLNHFLCYSIPKFNQMKVIYKVDQLFPESILAIQELIICTGILALTYYTFRYFIFRNFVEKEKFQTLSLTRWQLIGVATYVILLPFVIYDVPAMFLTIHFAIVSADMVLLMSSDSPGNESLARFLRLGVYISSVVYFIRTGALMMVGNVASYMFVTACLRRKYRMLFIPIILAMLASAFQVVKGPYRTMIQANLQMSIPERFGVLGELLDKQFLGGGEAVEEKQIDDPDKEDDVDAVLHGFGRLGDDSLERVISLTPSKVPYWEGESYNSIPFIFIPRLLWNDKPSRHFWNKFGRVYGYLGDDDLHTSVAINYFAEAYMNYGYGAMYFVAGLMGLFILVVERLSYYFLSGPFYFTFLVFLLPVMTFAIDLTSILQTVMFVSVIILLFRRQLLRLAVKDEYS